VAAGIRPGTLPPAAPPPPAQAPTWPPKWQRVDPSAHRLTSVSWPPTADQLDYWQKAITVSLLVLALPALIAALVRRPNSLVSGLARKHVG
jgi:hypothetical protein